MVKVNKQGLSRHIPQDVKRQIRAKCGFGCVICGKVPYQYDHVRIPFSDATAHDPDDIVLLCTEHHTMKTNQLLSYDDIRRALASRIALSMESRFKLPMTKSDFLVQWSGVDILASDNVVLVGNEPILSFKITENELEPLLLSGTFRGHNGQRICTIADNEIVWRADQIGDFELIGNRFTYKHSDRSKSLVFTLNSEKLSIQHIYHVFDDVYVWGDGNKLLIGNNVRGLHIQNGYFSNFQVSISIGSTASEPVHRSEAIKDRRVPILKNFGSNGGFAALSLAGQTWTRITSNYDRIGN